MLLELLDALGHAHARGVVHRDLKPGNVLLHRGPAAAPRVKLADFGIAHALGPARDEGRADLGDMAGTPAYMPPEQVECRWRDFGPWTDLYALGIMTYQLVLGEPPLHRRGRGRGADEAPRRPAAHAVAALPRPGRPRGWIRKLCAKKHEARFIRAPPMPGLRPALARRAGRGERRGPSDGRARNRRAHRLRPLGRGARRCARRRGRSVVEPRRGPRRRSVVEPRRGPRRRSVVGAPPRPPPPRRGRAPPRPPPPRLGRAPPRPPPPRRGRAPPPLRGRAPPRPRPPTRVDRAPPAPPWSGGAGAGPGWARPVGRRAAAPAPAPAIDVRAPSPRELAAGARARRDRPPRRAGSASTSCARSPRRSRGAARPGLGRPARGRGQRPAARARPRGTAGTARAASPSG